MDQRLQEYNYDSEHWAGTNHRNADALFKRPCHEDCKQFSRNEKKAAIICRTKMIGNH